MSEKLRSFVKETCAASDNDPSRMMDICRAVQARFGCVSDQAMDLIAAKTGAQRVEVEGVVTFYSFLSKTPAGATVIRLCNDIIDEMKGADEVGKAFCDELGVGFGETTEDGRISLEHTACIGMSDQAPAALVNDVVLTDLDASRARRIVQALKQGKSAQDLVDTVGDGNNGIESVRAMVNNNIRKRGGVVLAAFESGTALEKALAMTPAEVIRDLKTARLRGRGGAGFPTGLKWDFTRQAEGDNRYVLCNADEGEPGTFKDRVILTECPDLLFEGMTVGGYAIGAETGIMYLRGEYAYLQAFLEGVLEKRRAAGLLGRDVGGKQGFNFDIRIQMGAGAYICGEETALISSCEGRRGDPKTRPPFPAQKGYLDGPTTVNNVETFCCVARILDQGPGWFLEMGSKDSPGTKLLSVSGDCKSPGVYEVPFGITIKEMLGMVGATDAAAVQMSGPSGQLIGPAQFERTVCYDDIPTGGSVMIFNSERNVLDIVSKFLDFFVDESCGYCTPCRVGNVLLKRCVEKIRDGRGRTSDLAYLEDLGQTMKITSRCGLGQTAANPVLTTLENFRPMYEGLVKDADDGLQPEFDIKAALAEAEAIAGRKSEHF